MSPTALIPFCSFSGNFSAMGVKIDQFEIPVCKSFIPKISRGQICYTVDPNQFRAKLDSNSKPLFLSLFIDYNEDREFPNQNDWALEIGQSNDTYSFITIESIGMKINFF